MKFIPVFHLGPFKLWDCWSLCLLRNTCVVWNRVSSWLRFSLAIPAAHSQDTACKCSQVCLERFHIPSMIQTTIYFALAIHLFRAESADEMTHYLFFNEKILLNVLNTIRLSPQAAQRVLVSQEEKAIAVKGIFTTLNPMDISRHSSAHHQYVITKMTKNSLFWIDIDNSNNTLFSIFHSWLGLQRLQCLIESNFFCSIYITF